MLSLLDEMIGLHEHVEIHYEVDRYTATLYTSDGNTVITSGYGRNVFQALQNLCIEIGSFRHEQA
jgi:predicted Fe-Mo cluster-binding NifX family protein